MKPHPRIRKMVKWGGVVVTVLLLVLWVGNGWRASYFKIGNVLVRSNSGAIFVVVRSPVPPPAPPVIKAPPPSAEGSFTPTGLTNVVPLPFPPRPAPPQFPSFHSAPQPFRAFVWWFHAGWTPLQVTIPLWAPFALSLLITLWAWQLDALWARRPGRCLACNYDRTGLAAGAVCPECGQASTTS